MMRGTLWGIPLKLRKFGSECRKQYNHFSKTALLKAVQIEESGGGVGIQNECQNAMIISGPGNEG